ncbi:MAG: carbohydrate-binding family 9-like protein [Sphaerochaeta sp.]|jgi:hypothetical protein|uniref:carbohydrate-binding family 9-like protein n=1 Tax=Sphaerochaeta sp. TaxID=1972642 RepID=UPI003D13819D
METQPTLIVGDTLERSLPVALVPCWGSYEKTEGSLRIAKEGTILSLRYMVRTPFLRRMVQQHNQDVSDDSCVGLLIKAEETEQYLHLQCSASGALRSWWINREGERTLLPVSLLETIPVTVTLLENSNAQSRWSVEMHLDLKELNIPADGRLLGNFYSCCELSGQQYYLLAQETGTLEPDMEIPSAFMRLEYH